ncbi:MAG: hypothetical protein HND45_08085, partial [Chloroflexi bacterium]|nr:hypothetical protein [Chloroflexota bacterium]
VSENLTYDIYGDKRITFRFTAIKTADGKGIVYWQEEVTKRGGPPIQTAYKCQILKVTPVFGAKMNRGKKFTAIWEVRNNGNIAWDHNSVDYHFVSGKFMHQQPLYDLPITVPPGGLVKLRVAMKAPAAPGTYETYWGLRVGQENFCRMRMIITVK